MATCQKVVRGVACVEAWPWQARPSAVQTHHFPLEVNDSPRFRSASERQLARPRLADAKRRPFDGQVAVSVNPQVCASTPPGTAASDVARGIDDVHLKWNLAV